MIELSAAEWAEFSTLMDTALELEGGERERWLAELRASRPDMAERLEQALEAGKRADFSGFLADLPPLTPDTSAVPSLTGRQVGPYVIESEIGRGGMGSVWRARRTDGRFEGVVAIKFVHASWLGKLGEQRFRVEGRLLGKLNHPNIARLLDAGILETQPYLILEHVEGEPIDAYCARHGLGLEPRLRLFLEVLAAISHAHKHLVVHRDIKPSNIFVTASGEVKLLDFGIGKLLDDDNQGATQFAGTALTPEYAAPEQLQDQPVTTATDVFSAGLVLYLLLTGAHPIRAEDQSKAELIHAVLTRDYPRPSTVATLKEVRARALLGDLDNILSQALKKNPAERYASAAAFAQDLSRYLAHEPVQARPDSLGYRLRKFVRRNRGAVAAGTLLAMSLIAGAAGTFVQFERAQASAIQALQEKQQAIQQLTYAESTEDFLSFLLENESSKPFTTSDLLLAGERLGKQQFAGDPQLQAKLFLTLGNVYAEIEEQPKAQALFLAARAAASGGTDRSLRTEVDCALYENVGGGSPLQQSLDRLSATIRTARQDPSIDTGVLAQCLADRAELDVEMRNPDAAKQDATEALTLLGTPRPGQRFLAILTRTNLATAFDMTGDRAASLREYEKVAQELDQMGLGKTARGVSLISEYGVRLSRAGELLKAAAVYEHELEVAREAEGVEQTRPSLETNYAKVLTDLGRAAAARPLFETALQAANQKGNLRSLMYVSVMAAPTYCELGDLSGCERLLARGEELARAQFPPGHSIFGNIELSRAQLATARGDLRAARAHLQASIANYDGSADRNPNEIRARVRLARADLQLGDLAAAASEADDAVNRAQAMLHGLTHSAWLGSALLVQGEVRSARGDAPAARSILEQSLVQLRETEGDSSPTTREAQAALATYAR